MCNPRQLKTWTTSICKCIYDITRIVSVTMHRMQMWHLQLTDSSL